LQERADLEHGMDDSATTWQEKQAFKIRPYVRNPDAVARIRSLVRRQCEDWNPRKDFHLIWPDPDRDFPPRPVSPKRFEPPTLENKYVIAAAHYDACWERFWRTGPRINPWPEFDNGGQPLLSRAEYLTPAAHATSAELSAHESTPAAEARTDSAPDSEVAKMRGALLYATQLCRFIEKPNPTVEFYKWKLSQSLEWFVAEAIDDVTRDLESWLEQPAGRQAGAGKPTAADDSRVTTKAKRSTESGEGHIKLVAALTMHHQYADGSCLNVEPVGSNELARMAKVSKATASAFFKKEFKGHGGYKGICSDAASLAAALKLLNQEFSPYHLFGRKVPGEDHREED
jgi:hypothetical protein